MGAFPYIAARFVTLQRLITPMLVAALAWSGLALAQASDAPIDEGAPERIIEIRVEGNRRVEQAAVARALKQRVGDTFDPGKTADDLRALWALKYFNDVQLLVQRSPNGIAYVVRLEEKPAVRSVQLSGNDELSKDDLKDTVDIKANSILDLAAVKRNVKKVSDKYVEKGYFLAEITSEVKPVEDSGGTEVDVVIVIKEHAKVQVRDINFIGVQKVPVAELKAVMATKEGSYLSFLTQEGTYREDMFQRDLQVIQAAYYDRGFINVRVDKPVVSLSPDKRNISITLRVEEGDPHVIGKLDFSGDLIIKKEELKAKMTSREGEIFNRSLLGKDIQAITDVYYDSGYAYANPVPLTAINAEKKSIDLTFDINKGKQVTIERIDIVGNTKTRDKVLRRQLRVYEGELFNGSGMRRSKDKIIALGFFETVEVTHKPGRDEEHVIVTVEVKEKSTGTFQVGLGFSNIESFIFTAQVAQQNALGWGVAASFSAQISALRQFFQLSYFDPYFLDTNFIFSLDAYRTQLDYFGFVRDAYGGTASFGYYVVPDEMSFNVGYTREFVRVEPSRQSLLLADQFRSGNTSAARVGWLWDKRNNRLFPSSGWFMNVTAEFAPSALGGSYIFNRYTGNFRGYVPLPLGIVAKAQLQLGIIQQLQTAQGLPASELYYLGGIFSVRGYPIRTISPTQLAAATPDGPTQAINVGGDRQIFLNVEIEFPIFEKVGIRGVLFYDAGNTFARGVPFFQDLEHPTLPLGLFHSVGLGFRWFSPIGPLRFEWGFPLNRRPGIDLQVPQFEFTIGQSF